MEKLLQTYMTNFPGSFVGFFTTTSNVLLNLGNEWLEYAKEHNSTHAAKWGNIFISSAASIKNIANELDKISNEFNQQDFKAKVNEISSQKS